jgi:putative PIN family toxin of toxin-antitoxin system
MKVVLDTNCLVVALPQKSPYRCLWDAFQQGKYRLCYSTEILQEYEEVLLRYHSPETVLLTLELLLKSPNAIPIVPYYKWNLITVDPDDNKFVDCAANACANFVVTNDNHFNILKDIAFPKVNAIGIDSFKNIIEYRF